MSLNYCTVEYEVRRHSALPKIRQKKGHADLNIIFKINKAKV